MENKATDSPGLMPQPEGQLLNRYFLLIVSMAFFFDMCVRFFSGTFALHVNSLGGTATLTGMMTMAYTLSAALFRVIGGKLSDTRGRRITAIIGVTGLAFSSASFAFTTNTNIMLLMRALQGLSFAIGGAGFASAATDVIPKHRMAEGLGYYGVANSLAGAVGPMIALTVMDISGFNLVAYLSAALCTVSWLITFFFCNYEKDPQFVLTSAEEDEDERPRQAEGAAEKPNQGALASTPDHTEQGEAPAAKPDTKETPGPSIPAVRESFIWKFFEKKAIPAGIVNSFAVLAISSSMGYVALYAKDLGKRKIGRAHV